MRQFFLTLSIVLLITLPTNHLSITDARAAETPQPVPREYFGLHIHRMVQTQPWNPVGDKITPWPSIKFGSWRLMDAYVVWPNLEPAQGKWDFKTLDQYVAIAEKAGVDLVLPLAFSPAWASARPGEASKFQRGNAAEPRDLEDWRTYIRTVALRYKGRIKNYELWNEVNIPGFYSGGVEKLVELARVAYQVLKEVDPSIKVVSPSVVGEGHHVWLDEYLGKGGAQYLDVVGYHFYVPKGSPEAMLPLIQQVRKIMRKHGLDNKPLWNTETGWWIKNRKKIARVGAAGADWHELNDERAAAYVARSLILSWPAGVSRFYWYAWDNTDMGLIEPRSLELKPAAVAFDTAARWLTGSMLKQCNRDGKMWTCPIMRADGSPAWVVWKEDGIEQNWTIPPGWNIRSGERLDGSSLQLNGGSVSIAGTPVLLTSKRYTEK
jgi:hypothetical protein